MDSIWKNTRIQKKTVLIEGCCFRGVSVFRWKITLWWNVVPREDQRLRERGRGMKKERTMWRCRNATRFRTGFCCFRKLQEPVCSPEKERRISNVLTDCVEIVVSVIILRKMLGTFEWICYLWGELTLGIFAPLSFWGYGSTLRTLLWSHINVTRVFDGVKGLPPPCSVWMIGIIHVPLKMKETSGLSKGKSPENLGQLQGDLSPRCRRDDPMKRWLGDIWYMHIDTYEVIWDIHYIYICICICMYMEYTKRLKNYGAKGTTSNFGAILKETSIEDVHSYGSMDTSSSRSTPGKLPRILPGIHGLHFRHMGWASPDHYGMDSSYHCCQGIIQWATDPVSLQIPKDNFSPKLSLCFRGPSPTLGLKGHV